MFWTRIGTATGEYASGTVEEIEEHIKAGRPVMLYFSSAPVLPDSVDPDQYRRLKEFRLSCQSRGLYEPYSDIQDFRTKLYRQLQLKINRDEYFQANGLAETVPVIQEIPPSPSLSMEAAFLLKECVADPSGQVLHLSHLSGTCYRLKARSSSKTVTSAHEQLGRQHWKSLSAMNYLSRPAPSETSSRSLVRVTRSPIGCREVHFERTSPGRLCLPTAATHVKR